MNRVLDLGSGDGFFAHVLSKNKANKVIGVDLSKESVEISKKRYPGLDFRVMNSEKMAFDKNFFDEIYAMDVLEHVDNLEKVLNEIKRILKQNGKLIVNIPYYKSEKWLLKLRPTYFKEIHHVRIFGEVELEELMKRRKFILEKKKKADFLHHIELFFLFKRRVSSKKQTSIGSWRDSYFTKIIHASMLFFDKTVIHTPLVYFPLWLITLPLGEVINLVGNRIFPKSQYYIFIKT